MADLSQQRGEFTVIMTGPMRNWQYATPGWIAPLDSFLNATVEYRNYNPSRASVMNDPRVQQTMGAWGGGSYVKVQQENLNTARVAWVPHPERTRLGDIWARALHEIYFDRASAADALKKASADVDKVLQEVGLKK